MSFITSFLIYRYENSGQTGQIITPRFRTLFVRSNLTSRFSSGAASSAATGCASLVNTLALASRNRVMFMHDYPLAVYFAQTDG
jgi:hypothetical protein